MHADKTLAPERISGRNAVEHRASASVLPIETIPKSREVATAPDWPLLHFVLLLTVSYAVGTDLRYCSS